MKMYDISNPYNPILTDNFALSPLDIEISNDYIFSVSRGPLFIWQIVSTQIGDGNSNPRSEFSLSPNYPNPFNSSTIIRYSLPAKIQADLIITDILGREVRRLPITGQSAEITWDGLNSGGDPVSSGVYFYAIAGRPETARRMALLR
jgi:hypothetical protein